MNSLKTQLIVGILTGITLLLGAGGTAAYAHIKTRLYEEFKENLEQRVESLAALTEVEFKTLDDVETARLNADWLEDGTAPPGHDEDTEYYTVWVDETGQELDASKTLGDATLPRLRGSIDDPAFQFINLPGAKPGLCIGFVWRAAIDWEIDDDEEIVEFEGIQLGEGWQDHFRGFDPAAPGNVEGPLVRMVFARVDTVGATLSEIGTTMIGLWVGCTLLGGLTCWLVVRRSLKPLSQLTEQIGELQEAELSHRIHLVSQPNELAPVTDELNRLLGRVEQALVRERTLTSNVAHELRTPIAGILSILEVTLCRLRSAEEYRESTEECLEIAKRLHWLITNLLSATRIDAGSVQLQSHEVRLENALTEWWEPFINRARERNLRVDWTIESGASIETDPEFLRVVVTNLYDNAVSYTPEGKAIRVGADSRGNILVGNDALELNPEILDRVFDPFWRNTETRNDVGVHVGLGLNLCKKIIELLGGKISANVRDYEDWFEVRLEMA